MNEQKNDLNFNEVYSENWESVFNYVRTKIRNVENAEDITMQVFERIAKHLPTFNSEKAQLNTWIFTITNRIIIDHFRSNKSNMLVNVSGYVDDNGNESFQFETPCNSDQGIENNELKEKIMQSFNNLKGLHKRVAEMYLLENIKQDEIARLFNIPLGTVKGTLNRAKAKLSEMLVREKIEYCIA